MYTLLRPVAACSKKPYKERSTVMPPDAFRHYKTGIPSIDQVHLRLIELVERIAALSRAHDTLRIVPALEELHRIQADHFSEEEQIMEENGFPFLKYHKTAHLEIMRNLGDILKRSDNFVSRYSDKDFVKSLLDHIDNFDLRFMDWLHEQEKTC